MTEFEKRHINCFETLVGVVLGLVICSVLIGIGVGLLFVPIAKEVFQIISIVIFIFVPAGFIYYIVSVAMDYSKLRSSFIAKDDVNLEK